MAVGGLRQVLAQISEQTCLECGGKRLISLENFVHLWVVAKLPLRNPTKDATLPRLSVGWLAAGTRRKSCAPSRNALENKAKEKVQC
jgi:hypothetical protein